MCSTRWKIWSNRRCNWRFPFGLSLSTSIPILLMYNSVQHFVQDGKPLGPYTRKLLGAVEGTNELHNRWKELLGAVEGTKTPEEIIYEYGIINHIDQLNLLRQKLSNQRMIRWRLLLDDFHPQIKHIAGQKNLSANAISRLEKKTSWRRRLGITARTITIQRQRSKPRNDNVVDCLDFEPGCDDERLYELMVEIE